MVTGKIFGNPLLLSVFPYDVFLCRYLRLKTFILDEVVPWEVIGNTFTS